MFVCMFVRACVCAFVRVFECDSEYLYTEQFIVNVSEWG